MTSLAAEKIETLPGLHACFSCADNLGCNLEPRCEPMAGCIKWRCRVCRAPRWAVGYDQERCNATGVHNGVTYHDGTHMAPLPDASGHYPAWRVLQHPPELALRAIESWCRPVILQPFEAAATLT